MYSSKNHSLIGIKCPECSSLNIEMLGYENYRCKDFHFNSKPQDFIIDENNRPSSRENIPPTGTSGSGFLYVVNGRSQQPLPLSIDMNKLEVAKPRFTKPADIKNCKFFLSQEITKIHDAYQQIQYLLDYSLTQSIDEEVWSLPGLFFFNRGNYSLSEMVYSLMLQAVNKISPSLYKGLALYQIGIAQMNNGNLDEGISNVLQAGEEDDKNQPTKAPGLPASQTRQKIIHHVEKQIGAAYLPKLKKDLPSYFNFSSLASLLSKLSFDERLFLVRLILGRKRVVPRNDSFTKIIMFNNLLNVYVLTETFLGKAPNSGTLGNLIHSTFSKEKWFPNYAKYSGNPKRNPNSLTYYDDYRTNPQYPYFNQLQQIASKSFYSNMEENLIVIMFLSSHLTRNYLAHHFNPSSPIFSNNNEYDRLFDLAVILLLYCLR